MKFAVVGSRTVTDATIVYNALDDAIEKYCSPDDAITIISGGAKGVDTIARGIAEARGYDFILFKPYHMIDPSVEYTPKYFFTRNKQIADNADVVVIIWDGKSPGTADMVKYCKKKKKTYTILVVTPSTKTE